MTELREMVGDCRDAGVARVDQGAVPVHRRLVDGLGLGRVRHAAGAAEIMDLNMKNGRSVKLEGIGTFRYKVSAAMVDKEADAGESLIRDVRVQFTPERTVTAVDKQRITRRALIPDNLTWEIYDKPSKPKKTTEEGGTTPTPTGGGDEG